MLSEMGLAPIEAAIASVPMLRNNKNDPTRPNVVPKETTADVVVRFIRAIVLKALRRTNIAV
jgi:hypothetical protein